MHKANTQRALKHLKSLDAAQLHMSSYFSQLDAKSGEADHIDADSVIEAKKDNWCGTCACFAGHVQAEFATKPMELKVEAFEFAKNFLGMNNEQAEMVFTESQVYKRWFLGTVTLSDVIELVEESLRRDGWPTE